VEGASKDRETLEAECSAFGPPIGEPLNATYSSFPSPLRWIPRGRLSGRGGLFHGMAGMRIDSRRSRRLGNPASPAASASSATDPPRRAVP